LIGILVEFLLALFRAEVDFPAVVVAVRFRGPLIDLHAADWIGLHKQSLLAKMDERRDDGVARFPALVRIPKISR
jgi:hypothetical protein